MTYAPVTRTWGDVDATVKRLFGDESGVQLEQGDITRWINQGQYEIARQNKILKAKGSQLTTVGKATYALTVGRDIEQIESIRYQGNRLIPTEFTTVDANLEQYPADAQGEPKIWYKWGNEITLWPAPKSAEILEIFFTAMPRTFVDFDSGRKLEIPDNYFLPLVDFILARAHEMDDNVESQQLSNQLYAERMAMMNDEERAGQSMTFSRIVMVED